MSLTETINDLEVIKAFIDSALIDAKMAQTDADASKTPESECHPFDWTEQEWREDGFGSLHLEALHLLDEARQQFKLS